MRLSVMVLGGPADSSAPRVALRMLEVAQVAGHVLDTLFLYHKGAYAALNPHNESGELRRWSWLADNSGLRCVVCRTAWANVEGVKAAALAPPFVLGGLPDWLLACDRSDRVIRLGSLLP
jgi:sulfur relay (sulfurtransferase) complex TusBCD TusD component (DsrE family)